MLRQILNTAPSTLAEQRRPPSGLAALSTSATRERPLPVPEAADEADPLAELRQARGWVDQMDERQLWGMLTRIRWPYGPRCPHCGEQDPHYLRLIDPDYRGGLGRWLCLVCAEAGDPGEGGTFTPLSGTILDGMRMDVRTLWLVVEMFADGQASVETADEARVDRHTTDRLFRLLRAAIYDSRSLEPLALGPEDVTELDEVYITAGLKGRAGGLPLERQTRSGAQVYTDSYCIYHFLSRDGYQHRVVNHSAGRYALDLDGDGRCEAHCNTMECTWSWLRQMIRTYRGVSKVYLPLYVAQFEFPFNRRHKSRWNRTLDVLQVAFQTEAAVAADLLARVESAQLAEVCPVAG